MLVQGDATGDVTLLDWAKEYIKKEKNKSGEAFVGLVHRLDRVTSGVIVLARTSKALTRLNAAFKDRLTQKTYWAVVQERPKDLEGKLVHHLIKDPKANKSRPCKAGRPKSKEAILRYSLKRSLERYHLLEVHPVTGRHHQIRCQLSTIGCPIKGDIKYGFPRPNEDKSIHLHARSLRFSHPTTKEAIYVEALPPMADRIWELLSDHLA
ncbi:MAG TPA: RNA pseudouridine synthase [Bacteroidetes bacterium]|nr:RNA pseudouridine synthase [Bacteroidota bacterium]|tara:strand:+ start:186 stop:812 length:627 start_codon:yes stop_codon:yes gene_type:complete